MIRTTKKIPAIQAFWAKTSHDPVNSPDAFHPLICHLIDVACVALEIWDNVLPNVTRMRLAKPFGLENDLERAGKIISAFAGLHDLGKCSPPFALRGKFRGDGDQTKRLSALYVGTDCDCDSIQEAHKVPHGYVTAITLPEILCSEYGFDFPFAKLIAEIIGGHHGIFATSSDFARIDSYKVSESLGNEAWDRARKELVEVLFSLFDVSFDGLNFDRRSLDNSTSMVFAGFVSVSDWIGSNTDHFKCRIDDSTKPIDLDLAEYIKSSRKHASDAINALGWNNWPKNTSVKNFDKLFPEITSKRDLQQKAIDIAGEVSGPGIFVIEALMGEGKTEAAMYLADHLNATLGTRGIYFALPTQATSDQMFGRVSAFLESRFEESGSFVNLMLQHGHASLSDEFSENIKNFRKIRNVYGENERFGETNSNVGAAEWFTYKKRGLLAPFGVGTIDQILFAALQTKHVFVRLFGLAHKTIIIDEVHAYDAYMSTLLGRLLEWLGALGSPVIILSATLPKQRRTELINAYLKGLGPRSKDGEVPVLAEEEDVYPRISYAFSGMPDDQFRVVGLQTDPQNVRTLSLEFHDNKNFVAQLKEKLAGGGCAAIICNTVRRAQDVYQLLKADPFFDGIASDGRPKLDLLHARYRFIDRQEREKRVLARFGKQCSKVLLTENGKKVEYEVCRPYMAVLVSTQIIEQSLDLDFDLMITDLAPADLILQRAGRLQRHQRSDRAPTFINERTRESKALIWILRPPLDADGKLAITERGEPDFGDSGYVYDRHILLRTWLNLYNKSAIKIPDEIEELIEATYVKEHECVDQQCKSVWDLSLKLLEKKRREKEFKAKAVRIAETNEDDFFDSFDFQLDEDDPNKHATLRALTRDQERPSVAVVVLTKAEAQGIDLEKRPSDDGKKYLLNQEVKLSHFNVTRELLGNPEFSVESWKASSLLRHHRLIILDETNCFKIGKTLICLDPELGVVYQTKGEQSE
ncbi:MAG TPA: CRISPR-associated helicase Cas3' [Pyrinomonadaceae bacterium]|nr:CRISPR-associated helicase Cas3' [Pyrinomonadaceae bacterium]HMP66997.1 CRISPR-associated helicase Cas3' [Pyrinomonadaceae bacterium]